MRMRISRSFCRTFFSIDNSPILHHLCSWRLGVFCFLKLNLLDTRSTRRGTTMRPGSIRNIKLSAGIPIVALTLSLWGVCVGGFLVPHVARAPGADSFGARTRARNMLAGLRCAGGIIIAADGDDLNKELNRIQVATGEAEVEHPWRSEALFREWNLPLHGERVMFTTPRQYAGKLSSCVVEAGGRPVWMPTARYLPLPETGVLSAQLDVALLELHAFDVIGFASRYAVHGFWERLTTLYGGELGACRVISEARVKFAAVPSLSKLLRDKLSAFKDRIIPAYDDAQDLSEVLSATSSGAAVLCLAPAFEDFEEPKALEHMLNKLTFRGLDVTRAPAYQIRAGDETLYKQELQLLRDREIDVLGLTSALEVQGLYHMLGNSWDQLPEGLSVVGNGRETATAAAALGLDVLVLGSKNLSGEEMVCALADHCSSKRGLQIYLDH
jgi:uroporphyrinogen-III synthase